MLNRLINSATITDKILTGTETGNGGGPSGGGYFKWNLPILMFVI